jgi:signal transduction histidine kinase
VDDLLDVSRITRGKIQLRKERVTLQAVVNHAVETVRPFIESRKHQISASMPPEAIWLEADPLRMEQVLVNLLNNAAKYTEPGATFRSPSSGSATSAS